MRKAGRLFLSIIHRFGQSIRSRTVLSTLRKWVDQQLKLAVSRCDSEQGTAERVREDEFTRSYVVLVLRNRGGVALRWVLALIVSPIPLTRSPTGTRSMISHLRFSVFAWALSAAFVSAGDVSIDKDVSTGWDIYTLQQGETRVRVAPSAGANAFSVVHRGTEYLRVPDDLSNLPGVGFGNPILYPMPNRVRGAKFSFEGKDFEFPQNGRGNFIHGLVHSQAFEVESFRADAEHAAVTCRLKFEPGSQPYQQFPLRHDFRITISVREGAVRWSYEVDNREGDANVPFGVGFHPYVIYQKSREQTFLHAPATHLMESTDQLPSGELVELGGHRLDARSPRSLDGFQSDDVFFGMTPDKPAQVQFRDVDHSITFRASAEFTHLVVWTPDQPYFGIENQTCSTDAHNLAAQGKNEVAHLQVCPPGSTMSGSVEYVLD